MNARRPDWHLDRRISVALIFAFVMQFGATVYWGASMAAQVATNEDNIATTTRHVEGLNAGQREIAEAQSGLSAQMGFLLGPYGQLDLRVDAGAGGMVGGR